MPPSLVLQLLTHTRGLVACAVTHGLAVGIDAERVRPVPGAQHIADTRFASAEARMLGACDAATIDARFLELWTLKEAYAKADPVLLEPIMELEVTVPDGVRPSIDLATRNGRVHSDVASGTDGELRIETKNGSIAIGRDS